MYLIILSYDAFKIGLCDLKEKEALGCLSKGLKNKSITAKTEGDRILFISEENIFRISSTLTEKDKKIIGGMLPKIPKKIQSVSPTDGGIIITF